MPLPTSREETVTAASQVKANTINKIQDCVVGAKKASQVRTFSTLLTLPRSPAGWSSSGGNDYEVSTGAATFVVVLQGFEVGDRVTAVTVRAYGDGVVDCDYNFGYYDNSAVLTTLTGGIVSDNNRAAAWGDFVITPTARVLGAGEMFGLVCNPKAANYRIHRIDVTYDRL